MGIPPTGCESTRPPFGFGVCARRCFSVAPVDMSRTRSALVLSDIHYASAAEKARGSFELEIIPNPLLRLFVRLFRSIVWRRDPFAHNHLFDRVLNEARDTDYVFANGDFSCDSAFIGVSDPPSMESARICLDRLRARYGEKLHSTLGDHELGKTSLFGGRGGMRLASWHAALGALQLKPFWNIEIGRYQVIGITSSLVALPVYEPETLPEELLQWRELRHHHLNEIRTAFAELSPASRVILVCHDPSALPFLWSEPVIQRKCFQIAHAIIGHLHSNLFLWQSRLLSGLPTILFLGNSIRRMSAALAKAKCWKYFNVTLCPSLAGIQLLKDGGYYELELDPDARQPVRFTFRHLPWTAD